VSLAPHLHGEADTSPVRAWVSHLAKLGVVSQGLVATLLGFQLLLLSSLGSNLLLKDMPLRVAAFLLDRAERLALVIKPCLLFRCLALLHAP
jgi:hypothetical protein